MSRQAILAIGIFALFAPVLATFTLAFSQGGGQCRLAFASGSKVMSEPVLPQAPVADSKDLKKSGASGERDLFDECYQTCWVSEMQPRYLRTMCWLGCAYSPKWVPTGH